MTIGNDLDQAFYNLGQRITRLEKKEVAYPIENDFADRETVLGIEADLTSQVERIEAELNDRIDEVENFDPDDLRCDLESQVEDLRDCISYESDRIDDIDCYKITEDEARNIALDVVRDEISDVISDYVGKDRHAPVWQFAGDRRRSLNIFEQQVRRTLERVGIHKTRPIHTLRDTCLSRLGQAGCTGFEIMQWSGHKDLKSVAIYVQMDMSRLDRMKTLLTETTSTPTVFTDSSVDLRQVVGNLQQARP